MGHISAINRHKRPQEGPTSGGGSGPGATLRHTYDLIDYKTLQVTNKRCFACREYAFYIVFLYMLNNHHIALDFIYSTVSGTSLVYFWGPFGVRLGLLAVLEPSEGDSWPSGRNF